jgi:DNA primase
MTFQPATKPDLLALIGQTVKLKRVAMTHGGEYMGACPFCGGRDRFRVWPFDVRPGWWCRMCTKGGDAIQYLREQGHSFQEACKMLDIPIEERAPAVAVFAPPVPCEPPNDTWRARAQLLISRAARALWSSQDAGAERALAYLEKRGLSKRTILDADLGYIPEDSFEERSAWGLPEEKNDAGRARKVWLPRGILIPWLIEETPWKLNIRRSISRQQAEGGERKYIQVSGGTNALYGADTLAPNAPVVLVEGEFDALVITQEAIDLAGVVATGSTAGARHVYWIGKLALAGQVLVAFDNDEGGEQASAFWIDALNSQVKRWRPFYGDPSDMHKDGISIRDWLEVGLQEQ